MGKLDGKVCIITGGAGSVGFATAKLFLAEGAKVTLVDLPTAKPAGNSGGLSKENVLPVAADVSKEEEVKGFVDATVARWGGVDVLFSNAGNFGAVAPVEAYPMDVFDAVYAVHVKGALHCFKHTAPHLRSGGSVIVTSSVTATFGSPGQYAYFTAKHAQVGLMRCLAKELAPRNIRVNTIHPGPIDNTFQTNIEADISKVIGRNATEMLNEMIPLGRHAHPEEIARSVLYLASDDSSFVTGSMLMADGGLRA